MKRAEGEREKKDEKAGKDERSELY